MGVYSDDGNEHADWFRKSWAKAGKKLDMGKCCVRFTKLEDVALDVLGEAIRRIPAKNYVDFHTQAISRLGKDSSGSAGAAPAKPEPAAVTAKPPSKQSAKQHRKPASTQHGKPGSKQSAKQQAKKAAKKPAKKPTAKKAAAKRR